MYCPVNIVDLECDFYTLSIEMQRIIIYKHEYIVTYKTGKHNYTCYFTDILTFTPATAENKDGSK